MCIFALFFYHQHTIFTTAIRLWFLCLIGFVFLSRPVSAYALFFRDTQAAIKGQNPNASFGEVSKIVASMWDSLDVESKHVSAPIHFYVLLKGIEIIFIG